MPCLVGCLTEFVNRPYSNAPGSCHIGSPVSRGPYNDQVPQSPAELVRPKPLDRATRSDWREQGTESGNGMTMGMHPDARRAISTTARYPSQTCA